MDAKMESIRNEAVSILQNLIRINTSNPPGNEMQAVLYIEQIAKKSGIDYEIIQTAEGRGNIILKISGSTEGPPLILLSHLDVVAANENDWSSHPFKGEIKDGFIWGRGAVDTKQLTTMELMTLILLKRDNVIPKRDIYMIATADEESGSKYGMKEILKFKNEIFTDADVISEGGGFPIKVADKTIYLCETGQKGSSSLKFKFKKKTGGNPYYPDNSRIADCSKLVKIINSCIWESKLPETTIYLINLLSKTVGIVENLSIEEKTELLKDRVSNEFFNILKAMTRNTITTTIWRGGKNNCSTDYVSELYADVRLLPGVTKEILAKKINNLVSGLNVEWEMLNFSSGYDSKFEGGLFKKLRNAIFIKTPGYETVPFIATGGSDGRFLNEYESKVYGFSPVLDSDMTFENAISMVHGINERISIESLIFGIDVLYTAILDYCGEVNKNDKR